MLCDPDLEMASQIIPHAYDPDSGSRISRYVGTGCTSNFRFLALARTSDDEVVSIWHSITHIFNVFVFVCQHQAPHTMFELF